MTACPETVRGPPLTYRRILTLWLPLAGTWLMMAVEGPYLVAIIARLDAPVPNLAAFGVAFAFAIIIESPVMMLMSASTALAGDRESYLALRRFAYGLGAALTLVQIVMLTPPVFAFVAGVLSLPDDVVRLAQGGLALMLPWPAAIGYRRFRQGLLIRAGLTQRVAYGTAVRLAAMSATAYLAFRFSHLPGTFIGTLSLSAGVVLEAAVSRLMTASLVPIVLERRRPSDQIDDLRLGRLTSYYTPLALTSLLALASQPTVTFFMGQSRGALESLAVLPVVYGLTFIFRSLGLSYLEVVIALLGPSREHVAMIRTFAVGLGFAATAGLCLIAFTPLSFVWFRDVSGLGNDLTEFAIVPTRILAVLPAFSVLLAFERGVLIHARRNTPITWATLIELTGIAMMLSIGIHLLDLVGAVAAAVAILCARVAGTAWLFPTFLDVLRRRPTLTARPVSPVPPDAT